MKQALQLKESVPADPEMCGLQALLLYAIVLVGLFIVVVGLFAVGLFCVSRSLYSVCRSLLC